MTFDRFDICEAWFLFAVEYNYGMRDPIYRTFGRLERIRFKERCDLCGRESLTENGQAIYDALVAKHERPKSDAWQTFQGG